MYPLHCIACKGSLIANCMHVFQAHVVLNAASLIGTNQAEGGEVAHGLVEARVGGLVGYWLGSGARRLGCWLV
jgi:hypothetical protein